MYAYQRDSIYTAQAGDGLEELLAAELTELGAENSVPGFRFVRFRADFETLCRIVYRSRLATRILAPLIHFPCPTDKALYGAGRDIHWADFLNPDQTFAVTANVSESRIGHSRYAALKLKDAVADWFRDQTGRRPGVDPREPDLWLHLHIRRDRATISVDASGGSLHRRGYRVRSVDAPMQETLAAAIIRLSGWDGACHLVDPLCGSGTLLCEALMAAGGIPAAVLRTRFGFMNLPEFQPEMWAAMRARSTPEKERLARAAALIRGGDLDPEAVQAARENLARLPGGRGVSVEREDFFDRRDLAGAAIVANPPYGIRLGGNEDMGAWYKRLGDQLKRHCTGATAYIYFGDRTLLKHIGLRPEWKKPLKNGGLDGRLARFSLY